MSCKLHGNTLSSMLLAVDECIELIDQCWEDVGVINPHKEENESTYYSALENIKNTIGVYSFWLPETVTRPEKWIYIGKAENAISGRLESHRKCSSHNFDKTFDKRYIEEQGFVERQLFLRYSDN